MIVLDEPIGWELLPAIAAASSAAPVAFALAIAALAALSLALAAAAAHRRWPRPAGAPRDGASSHLPADPPAGLPDDNPFAAAPWDPAAQSPFLHPDWTWPERGLPLWWTPAPGWPTFAGASSAFGTSSAPWTAAAADAADIAPDAAADANDATRIAAHDAAQRPRADARLRAERPSTARAAHHPSGAAGRRNGRRMLAPHTAGPAP